jgi:hypothetical protein
MGNAVDPPARNLVFISCSCEGRAAKCSSDTNAMSRLLNLFKGLNLNMRKAIGNVDHKKSVCAEKTALVILKDYVV